MENQGRTNLIQFLNDLYFIVYVKIFPAICLVGLLLCTLSFITFINSKFNKRIYYFLKYKSLVEALILLTGVLSPISSCTDCATDGGYMTSVYVWAIDHFLRNVLYTIITFIEVLITIDRYQTIKSTDSALVAKKDKMKLLFFVILSFLIFVPMFFAFKIALFRHKSDNSLYYSLKNTPYGRSQFHKYYMISVNLFENVLTLIFIIPFNILVVNNFRRFIRKKIEILHISADSKKRSEYNFNIMILVTTVLFALTRLIDLSNCILNEFYSDPFNSTIINIFFEIFFAIVTSLNFFIYYIFNKPFRNYVQKNFFNQNLVSTLN
jgi:hypothetical protein